MKKVTKKSLRILFSGIKRMDDHFKTLGFTKLLPHMKLESYHLERIHKKVSVGQRKI